MPGPCKMLAGTQSSIAPFSETVRQLALPLFQPLQKRLWSSRA
jgi:hypothetical protein